MNSGLESVERWAVLWRTVGVDPSEHFMYENRMPVMFRTRAEARAWIDKKYGYIRGRKDLRDHHYGWRVPRPVKAKVVMVPR